VKIEEEEEPRPVCQDCGREALIGYVTGDRCIRLVCIKINGPEIECGGRLDEEETR
jgi:hypothetical protein